MSLIQPPTQQAMGLAVIQRDLRDQLACSIASGLFIANDWRSWSSDTTAEVAKSIYKMADDLLKAREAKQTDD